MPQWINSALEIAGAISVLCGALSHIIPGKFGRVLGEIGVDVRGFLQEVRTTPPTAPTTHITIPPKGQS